jgi:hypothetical protein
MGVSGQHHTPAALYPQGNVVLCTISKSLEIQQAFTTLIKKAKLY